MLRKGLSSIITSVLIILVVVAAVSVLFGTIITLNSNTSTTLNIKKACFDDDIKIMSCEHKDNNLLMSFRVIKNSNNEFQANRVSLIADMSSGQSNSVNYEGELVNHNSYRITMQSVSDSVSRVTPSKSPKYQPSAA